MKKKIQHLMTLISGVSSGIVIKRDFFAMFTYYSILKFRQNFSIINIVLNARRKTFDESTCEMCYTGQVDELFDFMFKIDTILLG